MMSNTPVLGCTTWLALALLSSAVHPTLIRVPEDFQAIQEALDATAPGDTVLVAPGSYPERINFPDHPLILSGVDPADSVVVAGTIIDGTLGGTTVHFTGPGSNGTRVAGISIQGGWGGSYAGGGIDIRDSHPIFFSCFIRDNRSVGGEGGGIHIVDGGITMRQCRIEGNESSRRHAGRGSGGGIYALGATIRLYNCVVAANHAGPETGDPGHGYGGGIWLQSGMLLMENSSILGNRAIGGSADGYTNSFGGGIHAQGSELILSQSTLHGNSASGGTWAGGGGIRSGSSALSITGCTISTNHANAVYYDGKDSSRGGGVSIGGGQFEIVGTSFLANDCSGGVAKGGGVFVGGAGGRLAACIFDGNTSEEVGGGLSVNGARVKIRNCIFTANQVDYWNDGGGALWIGPDGSADVRYCTLVNNRSAAWVGTTGEAMTSFDGCIFWNNHNSDIRHGPQAPITTWSDLEDLMPGIGNISFPPELVDEGPLEWALRRGSPCIDSARPTDEDGLDWEILLPPYAPYNTRNADMGAFGGPQAALWSYSDRYREYFDEN